MALYDNYSEYRDPDLSETEWREIAEAQEAAKTMEADATLERRPGGFWNEKEGFTVHPVVGAHIMIATDRAEAQFKGHPAMPEDAEVGIRFPGVDPVGKYSVIDMKFAQREAAIRATLESRSPEVQAYAKGLLDRCASRKPADVEFYQRYDTMKSAARKHRALTRASKLCLDEDGRRMLHQQARSMESDLPVEQYDKLMQGIEYAAGVRQGPVPAEITGFYKDMLHTELDLGMVAAAQSRERVPAEMHVEFQNLENKLLQTAFARPENWGKSQEDLSKAADAIILTDGSNLLDPYAQATADRLIDPLFRDMEKPAPAAFQGPAAEKAGFGLDIEFSRGDLISIDGMTVREKMQEDYKLTGGRPEDFGKFYQDHVKEMTRDYVAAGLMAGKRVEAFVPDKFGQIPKEPTQITKTGYEPTPLKPEHFNAWQRHFAKRGFYKAKVERQAEYERIMAARERMKAKALTSDQARRQERVEAMRDTVERSHAMATGNNKALFFGEIMGEMGFRTFTTTPEGRTEAKYDWQAMDHYMGQFKAAKPYNQFSRVEPMDACIIGMVAQGHKLEDILDPNKLQNERRDMARQVLEHGKVNDQEWMGRLYFNGFQAAMKQLGEMTRGVDFHNEAQLMRVLPQVEVLSHSAFSLTQALADVPDSRLGYNKAAMEAAGGDMARGDQMAEDLFWKVQDISNATQVMLWGVKGQLTLADPNAKVYDSHIQNDTLGALIACARSTATLDLMKPGATVFETPNCTQMFAIGGATMSDQGLKALSDRVEHSAPEQRAQFARQAASGELTGKLLQADVKPFEMKLNDTLATLVKGEDGNLSLKVVPVERPSMSAEVKIKIDKELAGPEKTGPQVQAKQKAAPHKKAPQMGGPKR